MPIDEYIDEEGNKRRRYRGPFEDAPEENKFRKSNVEKGGSAYGFDFSGFMPESFEKHRGTMRSGYVPKKSKPKLEETFVLHGPLSSDDFMFYFKMMCAYDCGEAIFPYAINTKKTKFKDFLVDTQYVNAVEAELGQITDNQKKSFREIIINTYLKHIKTDTSYEFNNIIFFKEAAEKVNKKYFKK